MATKKSSTTEATTTAAAPQEAAPRVNLNPFRPSREQAQAVTFQRVNAAVKRAADNVQEALRIAKGDVWDNPHGLEVDDVVACFNERGEGGFDELYAQLQRLAALVNANAPGSFLMPAKPAPQPAE